MSGFFDKLPEISSKKQAPAEKTVFDPYAFLNLRPEPQTAEDRFKEPKNCFLQNPTRPSNISKPQPKKNTLLL